MTEQQTIALPQPLQEQTMNDREMLELAAINALQAAQKGQQE